MFALVHDTFTAHWLAPEAIVHEGVAVSVADTALELQIEPFQKEPEIQLAVCCTLANLNRYH